MRVAATPEAEAVVRMVAATGREDLVMVLGNGCCDSTAPYLYDRYFAGPDVEEVGRVGGAPIFVQRWIARLYPEETVTVDVQDEPNAHSFSLESALGVRFTLRLSRDRP